MTKWINGAMGSITIWGERNIEDASEMNGQWNAYDAFLIVRGQMETNEDK